MTRLWTGHAGDHGAIHALGNGQLLVYGQGPDLVQIVGPPYSNPSLAALRLVAPAGSRVVSTRRPIAAVWDHRWEQDGVEWATWSDTVDPDHPVYVRRIRTQVPLVLEWELPPGAQLCADAAETSGEGWTAGGVLIRPPGAHILLNLPMLMPSLGRFAWRGAARLAAPDQAGAAWRIHIEPGETDLVLATGQDLSACQTALSAVQSLGAVSVLQRSLLHWQTFAARRVCLSEPLCSVADDVAVLIKAQQGREGGVLAGHRYHTDYLRDAYGVGRGLLAVGHHAEAQAILDYYQNLFECTGMLGNSQTVGGAPQFQRNEHDEAEGPALVICQIFDLADAVGDPELPRRYLPLMTWGWQAMSRLLCDGMLPFSGDETYMAGHLLSRSVIEHGSAEGTALFIRSGHRLLPWLRQRGLWKSSIQASAEKILADCRAAFRGHFIRDGRLIVNQPSRQAAWTPTAFRRGFCQDCWDRRQAWNPLSYGIHMRSAEGRYLCPACHARPDRLPAQNVAAQTLASVSLVGPYLGCGDLIRPEEIRPAVEELLPALLGDPGQCPKLVGYDAGLLLLSLDVLHDPRADATARALLALRDQTGAWVEYYEHGKPTGCRARPWESGVNLAALIAHLYTSQGIP
jgi:hypothetical protein